MHQSPQKQVPLRRDRHAAYDLLEADALAERRLFRAAQPKARKHGREEGAREGEDYRERRRERD